MDDTSDIATEKSNVAAWAADYYIKRWDERTPDQQRLIANYLRLFFVWLMKAGHLPETAQPLVDDPEPTPPSWTGVREHPTAPRSNS